MLSRDVATEEGVAYQAALQTGATSLPATVPDLLSQLERQIIAAERQQRASMLGITLPREYHQDLRALLKQVAETSDPESSAIAKQLLDRLPD